MILNQVVKPDDLKPIIEAYYKLEMPIFIKLIHAGFNYSYHLTTGAHQFVLRIYLNNKYYIRSSDDLRVELELLIYLKTQGIPVATPVKNNQDEYLSCCQFDNTARYFALFNYAAGEELNLALKPDKIYQLGTIIARFHQASDHLQKQYSRYSLDINNILVEPIQVLKNHLSNEAKSKLDFFEPTYRELLNRVNLLAETTENFGLIHGDLNETNIHFDKEIGFTIFDFDHCGYGWRVYDLTPFWDVDARFGQFFIEGYESIRIIPHLEKDLIPTFAILRDIWDMGDILRMMPVWGEKPDSRYLNVCLKRLNKLSKSSDLKKVSK